MLLAGLTSFVEPVGHRVAEGEKGSIGPIIAGISSTNEKRLIAWKTKANTQPAAIAKSSTNADFHLCMLVWLDTSLWVRAYPPNAPGKQIVSQPVSEKAGHGGEMVRLSARRRRTDDLRALERHVLCLECYTPTQQASGSRLSGQD